MPKVLTEDQVAHFHREGYLSPVPVLSPDEVARYRGHLEAFEAKHPEHVKKLKSKSYLLCPWVDEMARLPRVLDVYEDLIGPNLLCYSMAWRVKNPDGRTHAGWHQDGAYNPVKPILVIGALALADCTVAHGCLRAIPGSHRTGTLPHVDSGSADSILSRGQYIEGGFDESKAVDLELKAGEIGLFNAQIIHSSGPNTTTERRLICLVEMMPTNVVERAHRDTAMLVRGTDEFHHVDYDPRPKVEFGAQELAAWQRATGKTGKNVFEGSPLKPTEVYGGDVKVVA